MDISDILKLSPVSVAGSGGVGAVPKYLIIINGFEVWSQIDIIHYKDISENEQDILVIRFKRVPKLIHC